MGGKKCRTGDGADDVASPAGANNTATTIVALVFLLLVASVLVLLLSPPPATLVNGKGPREPVELAIGIADHERWLDVLCAWAKLACLKLQPPEPRYDLRRPASVKKAAKKSLEMDKETVEHVVESVARAAEEILEKTTNKAKRNAAPSARRVEGDLVACLGRSPPSPWSPPPLWSGESRERECGLVGEWMGWGWAGSTLRIAGPGSRASA